MTARKKAQVKMESIIVVSRKGHDAGRRYLVAAEIGGDFILLVDGRYRTVEKPKLKRLKHVKYAGTCALDVKSATDADIRKALAAAQNK